jgi:hypothetical protein
MCDHLPFLIDVSTYFLIKSNRLGIASCLVLA